tara:strand:- start:14445 stop:15434 length:990 start_codon:yes stop_codon:yes gene_type:complete
MIISRVPFRISLFGGSTDYESFFSKYGSFCIGATIDKYIYTSIRFRPKVVNHESVIAYSKLERLDDHCLVENPLIRESLKRFKIQNAVDLHLFADIPSRTGLGGSSACCVGLCYSIRKLLGLPVDKYLLALDAIDIERNILSEPGGIQDQIWASYGGLNSIEIKKDGIFHVKPLPVTQEFIEDFQSSVFLVYTNTQRGTSEIAASHESSVGIKKSIKKLALEAYRSFCAEKISEIGSIMMENWQQKKKISSSICTPEIERLEKFLLSKKILGMKLLGSGGGGFMAVICRRSNKNRLIKAIEKKYDVLDLKVQFNGVESILEETNENIIH